LISGATPCARGESCANLHAYDGHKALLFAQDTASGMRALIAIHVAAIYNRHEAGR
jgi:hypothetical protein